MPGTCPEFHLPGGGQQSVPELRLQMSQQGSSRGTSRDVLAAYAQRPERFHPQSYAQRPGINNAASFHEAHYVQNFARIRNRGGGAPFAMDSQDDRVPLPGDPAPPLSKQLSYGPAPDELVCYASQPKLTPIGRPGYDPLPTKPLDRGDSYFYSRAVSDYAKAKNQGGNPIAHD